MSRLHEFERLIDQKLRTLFRSAAPEGEQRELIEVHRAILDEIASKADTLPRGRRALGYPLIAVKILVPEPARRRAYEVIFLEAGALERDLRTRLEEDSIEMPPEFAVRVDLVNKLAAAVASRGFDVSYQSPPAKAKAPAPAAEPGEVHLTVAEGQAENAEYSLRKRRINIGRLSELVDAQQRIVRRNHVAFVEPAVGTNSTVSRAHAHLQFDTESGGFRLYDDGSALGTTVLREGEIIPVAKGSSKGVLLLPGDEIVLGRARVRFSR